VGVPLRAFLSCTDAQKSPFVSPLLATLTHSVSRKSFPCHSYANTRDRGVTPSPKSFSPVVARHSPLALTPFSMNTCKSVSRQSTLTTFRMNTYEKQGEGGGGHQALNPQNPAGWPSARRWLSKKLRQAMRASAAVPALVRLVLDGRFASTDAGASSLQRRTPSHPQGFWLASR
jgi:hypothetical protein